MGTASTRISEIFGDSDRARGTRQRLKTYSGWDVYSEYDHHNQCILFLARHPNNEDIRFQCDEIFDREIKDPIDWIWVQIQLHLWYREVNLNRGYW